MPPIAGSLTLALKAIRETTQISMCVCVCGGGGGGEGRKDGSGGEGRLRLGWKEGRRWGVFVCSSSLSPCTVHSN